MQMHMRKHWGAHSMERTTIDLADFTAGNASALFKHAMRESMAYDIYGDDTTFNVTVLTQPIGINTGDSEAIFGGNLNEEGGTTTIVSGFYFKGRIQDYTDRPSPHAFLPNPCDLAIGTKEQTDFAARVMNQHTTFMSREGWSGVVPKVGDVVSVNLSPGDFTFNLQYAYFDSVVLSKPTGGTGGAAGACTSLIAAFGAAGGGNVSGFKPLTRIYNGANTKFQGQMMTNGQVPAGLLGKPKNGYRNPEILKEIVPHWDRMAAAFAVKFPGQKLGGSGNRSLESQVSLYNNPEKRRPVNCAPIEKGKCQRLAAVPGSSNHGWGLAIDTKFQDKGGNIKSLTYGTDEYKWLNGKSDPGEGAEKYGFWNPDWAIEGGSKEEAWHWEWRKAGPKGSATMFVQ